jgi:cell division protein FtsB
MARPKGRWLITGMQGVAIVVLTIVVFLVVDFGRRTATGYYVSQAEKQLRADIEAQVQLKQELEERRESISTDAYVEQWAREDAQMVRPGDRPIILVTPDTPITAPSAEPAAVEADEAPVPNWYPWWRLFFDTEPGKLVLP